MKDLRSLAGKRIAFVGYPHVVTYRLGAHISAFLSLHVPQVQFLQHLRMDRAELAQIAEWKPDAVIAHCASAKLENLARGLGCPIVNTSGGVEPGSDLPTVTIDQVAVGRLVARYLQSRNCPSCYLIGYMDTRFGRNQWAGLKEEWKGSPGTLAFRDSKEVYRIPRLDALPRGKLEEFVAWYEGLEAGTAIVADEAYLEALCNLALLQQGKPIHHLPLLALHDFGTITLPRLSAIRMPEERWGNLAAEKALRLIAEPDGEARSVYLAPDGVEERESTATVTTGDRFMRRALEVIQERAGIRTTVADVASEVGLVRRALEIRFRKHLDCTVLEEIHRVHVERAKFLLADTDLSIEEVAEKAGFTDHFHLRRIFKKAGVLPPAAYRESRRRERTRR